MKILITGGAGFIGSHLTERLLGEGHSVMVLDNFHTGSKDNILHLLDDNRLEVIRHDVIDPYRLEVDYIYNLACPASPIHYQRNPVKTVLTNVMGAINALNLAKDIKARVLQASTSEVYGDPEMHPQPERYWGNVNCIGPRSCYDEGKRVAETLMVDYYRENQVDIRIARIFNTYGPRMRPDDGRVVSNFILQALRGEPITIFGDGSQTRSFCFVQNLIDGLIRFMEQEETIGPMNLGNPDERSIKDIAELVIKLTDSSSKIVYKPLPKDDPTRRRPDISQARDVLNWQPAISLEEGLPQTIEYFRPLARRHGAPAKMPR
ncbi:MAG: SDR family oxidoreductase [Sedimentisphaerales bacterium]|nr:SDR family oxidoreductase [Sedimentisphaerales bacterium]